MGKTSNLFVLLLGTVMAAAGAPTSFSPCDINQDATINVVDIQKSIDEAFALVPATDDLNHDGVVNVEDVQIEVIAALGLSCLGGPRTVTIGSGLVSVENTFNPTPVGSRTVVAEGPPVAVENTFNPAPVGATTVVAEGPPVAIENSFSPLPTGPMTNVATGPPISVLNSVSPAPTSPQTLYTSSLRFSIFNGLVPTSLQPGSLARSLRFLLPVDPTFLAEALARGAQRIDGKPVCLDSDGDGICDADELIIGTSPFLSDTDGDGYPDGLELALGSDPLDPKSIPDLRPPGYFATPPASVQNLIPVAILTPSRQGAIHAANNR